MAIPVAENVRSEPSAITEVIKSDDTLDLPPELRHIHHLALQIRHNLQYEHQWSDLKIHLKSTITNEILPRLMISGLPPKRLYIHPDEQVELLKAEAERKRVNQERWQSPQDPGTEGGSSYASPEYEWVLPTHLREKWSLRRMAEVFDNIGPVEPLPDLDADTDTDLKSKRIDDSSGFESSKVPNKWRQTKRVVLATLSDDSTVVYYIVHDGLVKPRQN